MSRRGWRWAIVAAATSALLLALLILCRSAPSRASVIVIAYPLEETIFPPDIVAPTFRWTDSSPADRWTISLTIPGQRSPLQFDSSVTNWRPPEEAWERIKRGCVQAGAVLRIVGRRGPGTRTSEGQVRFNVSGDPVAAPLFYREVNIPFAEAVKDPRKIRWRFGSISSARPPAVVLEKLPTCANCHSFTPDGKILAMEVDSANDKGSYAIVPIEREMVLDRPKIMTWSDYRPEDQEPTFGLLAQISPDGAHVVCMVKDRSVFVPRPDLAFSQLFFPIRGILVYYRRADKSFHALPGADDPSYVQANPNWSPDGKTILFARAPAYLLKRIRDRKAVILGPDEVEEFTRDGKLFRYDLYRMSWNDGQGGKPEPLPGASANGKSNYFPRYSPDGRWIVFCQSNSYMLLQPDSQLYIMPAEGGQPRRMRCNTARMNSWHSWSPNGRWLVFSSKVNGPYTQLFLTHVDAAGQDSPPVLLENFTAPDRAGNIPEFVNCAPDAIASIRQEFLDDLSFVRAGLQMAKVGDHAKAMESYHTALTLNANSAAAYYNLGVSLTSLGQQEEAQAAFARAIQIMPEHSEAHNNLGAMLLGKGDLEGAKRQFQEAIQADPRNSEAYGNLGSLLGSQGDVANAAVCFEQAVKSSPQNGLMHRNLAKALLALGKAPEAMTHLQQASNLLGNDSETLAMLGFAFFRQGDYQQATKALEKAIQADPKNLGALNNLASILATAPQANLRDGRRALELAAKLVEATQGKNPLFLDTQAAACAEAGDFNQAVLQANKAIEIFRAAGQESGARVVSQRLELYKQGQPYRLKSP